jgi:putative ATP-dependent endonuclease of OLD family
MPLIRSVEIVRFRNLESFVWQPTASVNVLIGHGDSGKTNVLQALSLFGRSRPLAEFDYFQRDIASGFKVEIVVTDFALADLASEKSQLPIRGWLGTALTSLPENGAAPSLVLRASGTPAMELEYSLVAESGDAFHLSANLRQQLNVLFLMRSDDSVNNFRAQQGSLITRTFPKIDFRSPAYDAMQQAAAGWSDPVDAKAKLEELRQAFGDLGLPANMLFGMVPPTGAAAARSVAMFHGESAAVSIPFELAGDGTRNLSVLALASQLVSAAPILLVDEVETGLEPHRQRVAAKLVSRTAEGGGQAFVVTHAPAVVQTLASASHWYMNAAQPFRIAARLAGSVFAKEPAAAFARLSIICEGSTEVGLVAPLWRYYVGNDVEECGVHLVDAGGHIAALDMLEDMLDAKLPCAGFVDNENEKGGTRSKLASQCPLFTWMPLQMPEEAIGTWTPFVQLEALLSAILDARSKHAGRYSLSQLMTHIVRSISGSNKRDTLEELKSDNGEQAVRAAVYHVLKEHKLVKSAPVAAAVAAWYIANGVPHEMDKALRPFFKNAGALVR